MQWYRRRHLAFMEGIQFTEERPVRNFNEAFELTKKELGVFGKSVSKTASETKQKIDAMQLGKKMGAFWGKVTKKKSTAAAATMEEVD